MKQLIDIMSNYIRVSEPLSKELEGCLKYHFFKKREIVFDASKICRRSYFIEEGMLLLFYLKDGKEVSEFFCTENQWINSPKSFMKQEIDEYFIDAIEDTKVWSIHINDLMKLFNEFEEMERYARLDMGNSFIFILERLANLRYTSAQEKYQHFLETYKEIHHRIPLGMVASYIGITQETLSRLRKRHFLI